MAGPRHRQLVGTIGHAQLPGRDPPALLMRPTLLTGPALFVGLTLPRGAALLMGSTVLRDVDTTYGNHHYLRRPTQVVWPTIIMGTTLL